MTVTVTFAGSGDAFGTDARFQTCIVVDAPGVRFAIDFGASSLIALNKVGIPHNSIDTILFSHLHGDHCGGIPFLLLDAMLGAKRQKPLTIAGPIETTARLAQIADALTPGMRGMVPKFPITYVDMEVEKRHRIGELTVTTYPTDHTKQTNPTALRIEVADKVISYSGDGDWTDNLPKVAKDADLFIAECYFYEKPVKFHLNYPTIRERRADLSAKRMVLTHLSPEMIAHQNDVAEECAYDGLVITV